MPLVIAFGVGIVMARRTPYLGDRELARSFVMILHADPTVKLAPPKGVEYVGGSVPARLRPSPAPASDVGQPIDRPQRHTCAGRDLLGCPEVPHAADSSLPARPAHLHGGHVWASS